MITGFVDAESIAGVKLFHAGTAFEENRLVTAGGRVLGVTAVAEDLPAAVERAYSAAAKIHFDGMQCRRDIGAQALRGSSPQSRSAPAPGRTQPFPGAPRTA